MRKTIAYLLTVFVLTGLLTGCGAGQEKENENPAPEERAAEAVSASAAADAGDTHAAAEKEPAGTVLHIYCIGE